MNEELLLPNFVALLVALDLFERSALLELKTGFFGFLPHALGNGKVVFGHFDVEVGVGELAIEVGDFLVLATDHDLELLRPSLGNVFLEVGIGQATDEVFPKVLRDRIGTLKQGNLLVGLFLVGRSLGSLPSNDYLEPGWIGRGPVERRGDFGKLVVVIVVA